MAGITSLNAHILSRSSRKKFDITPVAGLEDELLFQDKVWVYYFMNGSGRMLSCRNLKLLPTVEMLQMLSHNGLERLERVISRAVACIEGRLWIFCR